MVAMLASKVQACRRGDQCDLNVSNLLSENQHESRKAFSFQSMAAPSSQGGAHRPSSHKLCILFAKAACKRTQSTDNVLRLQTRAGSIIKCSCVGQSYSFPIFLSTCTFRRRPANLDFQCLLDETLRFKSVDSASMLIPREYVCPCGPRTRGGTMSSLCFQSNRKLC